VEELTPMIGWRQELITIGCQNAGTVNDPSALMRWLGSDDLFINRRREKTVIGCLSILSLVSIALVIAGFPLALLAPVFTANFIVYFNRFRKITKLHEQVSRSSDLLRTYSSTIGMIEKEVFRAGKLKMLQGSLRGVTDASGQIRTLARLVNRLDSRLNVLVSIPLNLLFLLIYAFAWPSRSGRGNMRKEFPDGLQRWLNLKHCLHLPTWHITIPPGYFRRSFLIFSPSRL
jgi:hypothetical protein